MAYNPFTSIQILTGTNIPTSKDEFITEGAGAIGTAIGGPVGGIVAKEVAKKLTNLNKESDIGAMAREQVVEAGFDAQGKPAVYMVTSAYTWLPMAQSIVTNYAKDWSEGSGIETDEGLMKGLFDEGLKKGAIKLSAYSQKGEIMVRHETRRSIDYKMKLVFQGLPFRQFNYPILFQPKNAGEQAAINGWIKDIKKASAPLSSGAFFTFPRLFQMAFFVNGAAEMFRTTQMACTNVEVNYTPNNIWSQHQDGMPTAIAVNLSFTEVELLTADMIDAGH